MSNQTDKPAGRQSVESCELEAPVQNPLDFDVLRLQRDSLWGALEKVLATRVVEYRLNFGRIYPIASNTNASLAYNRACLATRAAETEARVLLTTLKKGPL